MMYGRGNYNRISSFHSRGTSARGVSRTSEMTRVSKQKRESWKRVAGKGSETIDREH